MPRGKLRGAAEEYGRGPSPLQSAARQTDVRQGDTRARGTGSTGLRPGGAVSGEVRLPCSKSIAQRLLVCASLAEGTTQARGLTWSEDVRGLALGLAELGVSIAETGPGDVAYRRVPARGGLGRRGPRGPRRGSRARPRVCSPPRPRSARPRAARSSSPPTARSASAAAPRSSMLSRVPAPGSNRTANRSRGRCASWAPPPRRRPCSSSATRARARSSPRCSWLAARGPGRGRCASWGRCRALRTSR